MQIAEIFAVDAPDDIKCVDELGSCSDSWTREMAKGMEEDIVDAAEDVIEDPLESQQVTISKLKLLTNQGHKETKIP